MAQFRMPSLGADMDAGTLYEWFIKPGAMVKRGDVIASVETDKGVIDIECFEEGLVTELLVEQATRVPVGQVIALIGEPATQVEDVQAIPLLQKPEVAKSTELPVSQPPPPAGTTRPKISPAARKLAAETGVDISLVVGTGLDGVIHADDVRLAASVMHVPAPLAASEAREEKQHITPVARRVADQLGVDLHGLKGSGPHGTIGRVDVEQAIESQKAAASTPEQIDTKLIPTPAEPLPQAPPPTAPPKMDFAASMRRAIALAMAKSNREIPHYYLESRIDMSRPLARLEAENAKRPLAERILPVVLLIRATARALVEIPDLNGFWRDDHFESSESIHIGFAISLRQGGLVTPAIHDADEKSLDELMAAMRDLITRTRGGRLRSSELTDATITLTSLGDTGVDKVYGVIYPPQVALVGFGKIIDQPWAENGMLGIRPILTATLAGDHRASDGRRGAQFLSALEKYLQELEA